MKGLLEIGWSSLCLIFGIHLPSVFFFPSQPLVCTAHTYLLTEPLGNTVTLDLGGALPLTPPSASSNTNDYSPNRLLPLLTILPSTIPVANQGLTNLPCQNVLPSLSLLLISLSFLPCV